MADYGSLEDLLKGSVDIKHNRNKSGFRAKADRIASKVPEVMVKVTGHTKGAGHMKSHLDYISRNGEVELEDQDGHTYKNKEAVKGLFSSWESRKSGRIKENERVTTSIVFSMPKGTDPQAVKASVREYAKKEFSNYKYVMALHEDTDSPHVHLTINNHSFEYTRSGDRRKFHVKKGDPQRWRQGFAKELRSRGVEAEATSRAARGIIKKSVSQVIKHIREKGFTPEMDKARVREIIGEFKVEQQGGKVEAKPWEQRIRQQQALIRGTWLGAAKELHKSQDPEDKKLGEKIVDFLKDMPPVKTLNQEVKERMANQLTNAQNKPKDNERQVQKDREEER